MDDILEFENEETIARKGSSPEVSISSNLGYLYFNAETMDMFPDGCSKVLVGKAKNYLIFHFVEKDKRSFKVNRQKSGGGTISFRRISTYFNLTPSMIKRSSPIKTKDGFAIKLY